MLSEAYDNLRKAQTLLSLVFLLRTPKKAFKTWSVEEHFPQKERASFWTTFKWLLWRCMKQQYLDPAFLAAKVLQIFGTSITIGELKIHIPKTVLKN